MATAITQGRIQDNRIRELCDQLSNAYDDKQGLGSMTCNVYDTSWVALVSKAVDGHDCYLFPESLNFILASQLPSGGWSTKSPVSHFQVGGSEIVASLAALFALQKISERPCQYGEAKLREIRQAATAAAHYLSHSLPQWDVTKSREVGFEYLVPALLELLEKEGFSFAFPQKQSLHELRQQKLSRLDYKSLYGSKKSTLLHSAEVFFGDANFCFDSIAHHKIRGSIMASPAATAAYLMRASKWDEEAELYLRHVMDFGMGRGSGAMPSAFPTTFFEITWVLSSLLAGGVSPTTVETGPIGKLYTTLREESMGNGGLIGFASDIEPDLDDTAQASIVFSKMGEPGLSSSMKKYFSGAGHFQTYKNERNASFSANCNALYAILLDTSQEISLPTTRSLINFLLKTWWDTNIAPQDKWNFSPLYSYMLISRTLRALLERSSESLSELIPDDGRKQAIVLVLFQCLVRTLRTQKSDGRWGDLGPYEETAYAILTLNSLKNYTLVAEFNDEITQAVQKGREFLGKRPFDTSPEQLWIEKTSYGSYFVSEAYIAAAMSTDPNNEPIGHSLASEIELDKLQMSKYIKLLGMVPLMKDSPRWLLAASWTEGIIYLKMLQRHHDVVFARRGMTEDKYFTLIPFLWTCVNNLEPTFLASRFIFSMMTISFLNFQADEFMEVAIGSDCRSELDRVRTEVHQMAATLSKDLRSYENNGKSSKTVNPDIAQNHSCDTVDGINGMLDTTNATKTPNGDTAMDPVTEAMATIRKFAAYVLSYPEIDRISMNSKQRLCNKTKDFILAHIDQAEASGDFSEQQMSNGIPQEGTQIFYGYHKTFENWLQTISAEHTSCPYSFQFALCLWEHAERQVLTSVTERYLAQDLCQRLAIVCRLYNDLGSIKRDRVEGNLNSVNFPEFHLARDGEGPVNGNGGRRDAEKTGLTQDLEVQAKLKQLADYEWQHLELAMGQLEKTIPKEMMRMIKVFVNITDLFGQIYVVKDLASQRT